MNCYNPKGSVTVCYMQWLITCHIYICHISHLLIFFNAVFIRLDRESCQERIPASGIRSSEFLPLTSSAFTFSLFNFPRRFFFVNPFTALAHSISQFSHRPFRFLLAVPSNMQSHADIFSLYFEFASRSSASKICIKLHRIEN